MASGSPAQINMLLQYKGGADEEECPVPHGIRGELLRFHSDLLAHCGEMGACGGTGGRETPGVGMGGCWDPWCGDMGTSGPPAWGCGDVGTPGVGIWGHGDPRGGDVGTWGPLVWGYGDMETPCMGWQDPQCGDLGTPLWECEILGAGVREPLGWGGGDMETPSMETWGHGDPHPP